MFLHSRCNCMVVHRYELPCVPTFWKCIKDILILVDEKNQNQFDFLTLSAKGRVNALSQIVHGCLGFECARAMCDWRARTVNLILPQCGHFSGAFSCANTCDRRMCRFFTHFPHVSHCTSVSFRSRCVMRCCVKFDWQWNTLAQMSQINSFSSSLFSCILFICDLKLPGFSLNG